MPQEYNISSESRIPPKPIPADAHAFGKRVGGLLDGQPKGDAAVATALEGMDGIVDRIATGLYTLASMLVGEGEDAVRLVETAIANAEVSACHDPAQARMSSRRALCTAALTAIAERDPDSLAAPPPEGLQRVGNCIEDDDPAAAGVSNAELERIIAGPSRDRVRKWLASLPATLRTIFVLRAVAGFTTAATAALLAEHGGPKAAGWTAGAVSETFRQGLCSLASQMLHNTSAR
jgi:hypothetical protein